MQLFQCRKLTSGTFRQWHRQQHVLFKCEEWKRGRRRIRFTDGLTSTATATSTACLDAVFFEVSVVCVTRAGVEVCFGIVLWALILIFDKEPNRCSESNPMLDSRLDLDQVFFISLLMERETRG